MALYSEPPAIRSFASDKPTLLVCWWITIFCLTIILIRIAGRFIRSERLFREDRIVALAIIPLFIRMGFVHVVLIYGTNNNDFSNVDLTAQQLRRRELGSGLVLAARIFHAATQWILKLAILEFFRRISDALSERFTQISLLFIRCMLVATFIAVVISDLAECHPFSHYWQVLPDPGGRCRQGYAQLLTMTVCNVITDLSLVFFPVPIILFSHQPAKRKVNLILLFSLGLGVVGATVYRVCRVIDAHGNQQLRSLLASVELLFATTAANALVLGSFVRDRGVKKNKFRGGSVVDSMDRGSTARSRRPTMNRHWGSDEDLVRDLGLGVRADLRDSRFVQASDLEDLGGTHLPRPAPVVRLDGVGNAGGNGGPLDGSQVPANAGVADMNAWQFPEHRQSGTTRSGASAHSGQSDDDALLNKDAMNASPRNNSTSTPRKVSFFDAGSLLDSGASEANNASSDSLNDSRTNVQLSPKTAAATLASSGNAPPEPAYTASGHGYRRGSSALLQDLGGLLSPLNPRQHGRHGGRPPSDLPPAPQEADIDNTSSPSPRTASAVPPSRFKPSANLDDVVLMDPGGLLGSRR